MKKLILTILILLFSLNATMAQQFPDFKPLRYDEDYGFLQKNTDSSNWYKSLKRSPLSKNGNSYISFGADLRMQYFAVKNEKWGDEPQDKDGYTYNRYLLHTDIHTGKYVRTFVQLQSSMVNGKNSTSPVDENPLEIHQAFTEISLHPDKINKLNFRIGRQEMAYGSQRLVAVRDGPNNRQSFDAAKMMLTGKKYKADVFYSHYVIAHKGIWDDNSSANTQFWGAYAVINKLPFIQNIDLYYFGLKKATAVFDDGAGRELRHSIGTRIWGKKDGFRYDGEAVWQLGTFAAKKINAWTASINSTYELSAVKFKPEFGMKAEFISGDKYYGDNKLQTFNPLFPRGGYFGLAAIIGPSNLFDIHPSISFKITPTLNWNTDYDIFWRYSRNDGLYAPSTLIIYSGKNTISKQVGQQLSSDIVYMPHPSLYLRGEITWFLAGDYLKEVSAGKNMFFGGITVQLRF
jgi:hypothetical protein